MGRLFLSASHGINLDEFVNNEIDELLCSIRGLVFGVWDDPSTGSMGYVVLVASAVTKIQFSRRLRLIRKAENIGYLSISSLVMTHCHHWMEAASP